jgi:hypothetical protein
VINLFKSLIHNCNCSYHLIGKDIYANFFNDNFHSNVCEFLGYPYSDYKNMIKNKYRYYIKIVIGDKIYDLYTMATASKKPNEKAQILERRCREYFDIVCPKSCIIYGYTKRTSYWEIYGLNVALNV